MCRFAMKDCLILIYRSIAEPTLNNLVPTHMLTEKKLQKLLSENHIFV